MPQALDDSVQRPQSNEVTCSARAHRPSEKVQAMLGNCSATRAGLHSPTFTTDEQQQEKQKQDEEAISKAKRRELLMRKRDQVSQAAKTDLRALVGATKQVDEAAMGPPDQLPVRQDSTFSARSVVNSSSVHDNPHSALTSPLILRKGNVPPIADRTLARPKVALPVRARPLTRTPSVMNILTNDAYSDDKDITLDPIISRKRVREREPTPFAFAE
ncbi:hypothetical protein EDD17DRAFT_1749037 [Pisolithus thermaeus]|nr:hypothetical protein EV401DRAFT_2083897 [Pisolithus croceorrhizus]KAI6169899.1 hypothetical protein EDD17DRAFT_1749037 [Pisolithus thermaeus]